MAKTKKSMEETTKTKPTKRPEKVELAEKELKDEDLKEVDGGVRSWPSKW